MPIHIHPLLDGLGVRLNCFRQRFRQMLEKSRLSGSYIALHNNGKRSAMVHDRSNTWFCFPTTLYTSTNEWKTECSLVGVVLIRLWQMNDFRTFNFSPANLLFVLASMMRRPNSTKRRVTNICRQYNEPTYSPFGFLCSRLVYRVKWASKSYYKVKRFLQAL